MHRAILLAPLALALAACDGDSPLVCALPAASLSSSPVFSAAVLVSVQDSLTGADLSAASSGAYVVGTYADSLYHGWDAELAAFGPAGRYTLVVQHAGYATWGTDRVRVPEGGCEAQTQRITAKLQRLQEGS
jgi:hypothetical protein